MNLETQLQILIDEAPQHGVPAIVMEKAVTPTLKLFAHQLQKTQYYVLQDQNRAWLVTTLSHRQQPNLEKRVIYAFATRKDAASFPGADNPNISIISFPVTHLLFQLFYVDRIDSIIFRDRVAQKELDTEILQTKLQNSIQQQLQRLKVAPSPPLTNIPPNFA